MLQSLEQIRYNGVQRETLVKSAKEKPALLNASKAARGFGPGPCFHCGKKGHKAAECYSNPRSRNFKGKVNSSDAANREGVRPRGSFPGNCNHCGKYGHKAFECFTNQASKNYRGGQQQTTATPRINAAEAGKSEGDAILENAHKANVARASEVCLLAKGLKETSWFLDSGCTQHMTHRAAWLQNFRPSNIPCVLLGDEGQLPVKGEGDLVLRSPYGELKLDNVLLVEKLTLNLISQSQLDSSGCKTFSDNGKLWVFDSDWKVVAEGARKEGLYEMCLKECNKAAETTFQAEPEEGKVAREELRAMLNKIPVAVLQQRTPPLAAAVEGITMETLHRRMGHASDQRINELLDKNMAVGVKVSKGEKEKLKCGACVEGKSTRTSHPKHGTRQPYKTLEIVAADICGPMRVASRHGSKYFITFTDLGTRHTWVTEIKEKSEALSSFIDWLAEAERQSGKELKVLRTDNGGEFLNTDFNSYLRTKGIRRQLTIPYTPQHNSVAERVNRSLLESVRSMLSDSGLPLSYWGDALGMACWLKNRLPTTGLAADITPHEAFYHRKPSLEFLRVWGCMTQYRELAGPDHKLLPRTKWGVHLGICPVSKGWVIKNVDSGKVTATRDVIFYENLNYREWKDGAKAHAATDKSTNPQPVQELLGSGADGIGTASDVSAAELEDDDSPVTWVWETTPTTEGDTVAEPEGQPGDAATSGQQSDQARNDQQPPATSEASDPWRLFDADSTLAAAATAPAAAATALAAAASALAAAATVLAAAAPALSAVLRAPRALQPCTPRAPCCLVRPVRLAALCTRICSPYPAPPSPPFLLPLPAARAAVGVRGGRGGEGVRGRLHLQRQPASSLSQPHLLLWGGV
ncbi:unnamed protein product [Closterium sp. NIES-54]